MPKHPALIALVALLVLSPVMAQSGTMTHNTDPMTIVPGSVGCATMAPQYSAENSYWRSYTLSAFSITSDITIDSIDFGIELAQAGLGAPDQPLEIRLHTDASPPLPAPMASLVLLHTEMFNQPNAMSMLVNQPITAPVMVLAGETLVVELFQPDGIPAQNVFFIGSNAAGQSDTSYISAPTCAITEPTDTAAIGFPNMHIILNVNYTVVGPPPPTCTVTAPVGTQTGDVSIDIDAMSTSATSLTATLEWSTDAGATYNPATTTPTSPSPNPAVGVAPGVVTMIWDSRGDGVALAGLSTIDLRATVIDTMGGTQGECFTTVDVDNSQLCNPGPCGDCSGDGVGPNILDALTAAQIAAGLTVPTPSQAACCDVNSDMNVNIIDALQMAQAAAGLMVSIMCL